MTSTLLTRAQQACGADRELLGITVWKGCPIEASGTTPMHEASLAVGLCYALSRVADGHPVRDRLNGEVPLLTVFCWHPELSDAEMDLFERLGVDLVANGETDVLAVVRALGSTSERETVEARA